jgi:flagellar protein FlbD
MVKLTRLNNTPIVINSDLIEFIEELPDTIITLTTGQKIIVREGIDDIIERVKVFKRSVFIGPSPGNHKE